MRMTTLGYLLAPLVLLMLAATPGLSADGAVQRLAARQKGIETLRVTFTQSKHTMLSARPVRSAGTLYIGKGRGVRWDYGGGEVIAVYDGQALYMYYPELGMAERHEGAGRFMGPLSFDMGQLAKDYDILAEEVPDGTLRLALTPRDEMPFTRLGMEFAPGAGFPSKVTVTEESGDRTVMEFARPEINLRLDDALFIAPATK